MREPNPDSADDAHDQTSRRQTIAGVVATLTASTAGCVGGLFDSERTDSSTPTGPTALAVRLDGAPSGLEMYEFELTSPDRTITAVYSGVISGEEFQIHAGGTGQSTVTVRAADLSQSVSAFEETRPLFTVTFDDIVGPQDVTVSALALTADDGDPIGDDQWRVVATEPP